ncbi:hypothetical protein [Sodalis sp. RH19]|uniref:hypothetical protein n=1 Tax=Sodalis sp. RH19 TaxID=3394334 RepID=UPI0039B5ABE0
MNNINSTSSSSDTAINDVAAARQAGPFNPAFGLSVTNVPRPFTAMRSPILRHQEGPPAKIHKPNFADGDNTPGKGNPGFACRSYECLKQELHKKYYDISVLLPHEKHLYLPILLDGDSGTIELLKNTTLIDDSDNPALNFHAASGRLSITTVTDKDDNEFNDIPLKLMDQINMHYPILGNNFYASYYCEPNKKKKMYKLIFPKKNFTGENFYLTLECANTVFNAASINKKFYISLVIMHLSNYLKHAGLPELNHDVIDKLLQGYPSLANSGKGILQCLAAYY